MEYSGAGGKMIHEKNQKQKISWHCPFKKPFLIHDSATNPSWISRGKFRFFFINVNCQEGLTINVKFIRHIHFLSHVFTSMFLTTHKNRPTPPPSAPKKSVNPALLKFQNHWKNWEISSQQLSDNKTGWHFLQTIQRFWSRRAHMNSSHT